MSIIAKRSRLRKLLKILYDFPVPMLTEEDFGKLRNRDLDKMGVLELHSERQRILLALTMVDGFEILHIFPDGRIVTAEGWLTERLQLTDRALRGAVD